MRTPLHVVLHNHESVRALCAHGADNDRPDATGRTPLHFGVTAPRSLCAVNALLDAGVDASFHQCDDDDDDSPLDMAAWRVDVEFFRTFLGHGAVSTVADSRGRTGLHKASY